jgi:hypothetical protein
MLRVSIVPGEKRMRPESLGGKLCIDMEKIHLVFSKLKSNHKKCEAAFHSASQAEAYRAHRQTEAGNEYRTFVVEEVSVLDGTPKMNRIMLGFPEGTGLDV